MFFFSLSLPLSQTSWEGYTALCVQRHSLFIFPSLILPLPHSRGTKGEEEGKREVFHLGQEGHGEERPQRSGETEREGAKRADNEEEKGDVSTCLCSHVLCSFPLVAV